MRVSRWVPILFAVGCANAKPMGSIGDDTPPTGDDVPDVDAPPACTDTCDQDGDGVFDQNDDCVSTPAGAPVNIHGCSEGQVPWKVYDDFPPFGLLWTSTGNLGRAGGMTWKYENIDRSEHFHIAWLYCDDPTTPCGLSLDGPIDDPTEAWTFSPADSDLANGRLAFTNVTHILLADTSRPQLDGRVTLNLVDAAGAPAPWSDVPTIGVTNKRDAAYGAEIAGVGFAITAIEEVRDGSGIWTPYLDYYDVAQTPDTGGQATVSFGGTFYAK